MKLSATFSPCRRYRYTLWREFDFTNQKTIMVIGLNPSTADERNDDPTIRRCIRFSRDNGMGRLCMTNLFAFRATDPEVMKAEADPIGPENDYWLEHVADEAAIILAAWGIHGSYLGRDRAVKNMLSPMKCLGLTKAGFPRHPLYVPADQRLIDFAGREWNEFPDNRQ